MPHLTDAEPVAPHDDPPQVYLDTPSMGLPTGAGVRAIQDALTAWADGRAHYSGWETSMQRCREMYAVLAGVTPDDVGLLPSVVPAASAAGAALAPGNGAVVAHRAEFRSLLLPVIAQVEPHRMRWVDGPYLADTFTAAIDEHTDAVLVSAVSSHDGARPALQELADACADVGADLLVDGTQAMGIVVPDVDLTRPALFACAGYKGLRAPRGTAYALARRHVVQHFTAPSPYGSADTAERATYGPPLVPKPGAGALDQSPAWLSWVGAEPPLQQLLEEPADQREHRVLALTSRLRERLHELGLTPQRSDLRSPIVTFAAEDTDAVLARLGQAGIRATARQGRVRVGFHVYNDDQDVDLLVDALRRCPRELLRSP